MSPTEGRPLTIAIQYPSLGPNHPARLEAIARASPYPGARVVAMEMFRRDSDYLWDPVTASSPAWERLTVMDCESAVGRGLRRELRRSVRAALDRVRPDVLVVNGWGHRESRRSLEWAAERGCPLVLLSDSRMEDRPRVWWKEAGKRWLARRCRSAFVSGTPQARYAEFLGVPRDKIFHPGACVVDNDFWSAAADAARTDAEALRASMGLPPRFFLCVARLIEKKNVPFLVRAYGRYRAGAGEGAWGLVICGSGPEEAEVRRTIQETGMGDAVKLLPFQQAEGLGRCYGLALGFVMPSSHYEQWGLVVNEAMAAGLPVLVSRQAGCAEDLVREGENGFTFDPRDEEALAARMLELAGDGARRGRMAARSLEIIEGHSCEAGARNLWLAARAALEGPRR